MSLAASRLQEAITDSLYTLRKTIEQLQDLQEQSRDPQIRPHLANEAIRTLTNCTANMPIAQLANIQVAMETERAKKGRIY